MNRRTGVALFVLLAGLAQAGEPVTLWAAGDIAQCGVEGARQTGEFLRRQSGPILALGDLAYPKGRPEDFANCFAPAWGTLNARLIPVPGNHEYGTPGAAGYFEYFGSAAGEPGRPWHSRRIGAWRIIGLDSNLEGAAAQAQVRWLEQELTASREKCVLAFYHHPRHSSGHHGDQLRVEALWQTLARHGTTLVLAGHDHHYERFAPRDGSGAPNPRGIRSFIVGTGGARLYDIAPPVAPSEFTWNRGWGVLRLTLETDTYRWQFMPSDGSASPDSGLGKCVR